MRRRLPPLPVSVRTQTQDMRAQNPPSAVLTVRSLRLLLFLPRLYPNRASSVRRPVCEHESDGIYFLLPIGVGSAAIEMPKSQGVRGSGSGSDGMTTNDIFTRARGKVLAGLAAVAMLGVYCLSTLAISGLALTASTTSAAAQDGA